MDIKKFMPIEKIVLRQDMNLIEFPFWSPDRKDKNSFYKIETKNGLYIYETSPNNIPDDIDILFLYILLFRSQIIRDNGEDGSIIEFNAYNIIKDIIKNNKKIGKKDYDRFEKALIRWSKVNASFKGNFYNVSSYTKNGKQITVREKIDRTFGVLKYDKITNDKVIEDKGKKKNIGYSKYYYQVALDKKFLDIIEKSNFIKNIDISVFIALKKPTYRRLYEWLPKQFLNNKDSYSIKHKKFLREKMRMAVPQYISQVAQKLNTFKTAVKCINDYDNKWEYKICFKRRFKRKILFNYIYQKTSLEKNIK